MTCSLLFSGGERNLLITCTAVSLIPLHLSVINFPAYLCQIKVQNHVRKPVVITVLLGMFCAAKLSSIISVLWAGGMQFGICHTRARICGTTDLTYVISCWWPSDRRVDRVAYIYIYIYACRPSTSRQKHA